MLHNFCLEKKKKKKKKNNQKFPMLKYLNFYIFLSNNSQPFWAFEFSTGSVPVLPYREIFKVFLPFYTKNDGKEFTFSIKIFLSG